MAAVMDIAQIEKELQEINQQRSEVGSTATAMHSSTPHSRTPDPLSCEESAGDR
jgi:hypothetical protein